MVTLIKDNLSLIQDVCAKHHVKSFYLIGSAARQDKDFTPESDVDFLFRFNYENADESCDIDFADNYFSLREELQNLLQRKVDLVSEERNKNPYFINSINKDKTPLYSS